MARVELTKGDWAHIRDDIDEITNAERDRLMVVYEESDGSELRKGKRLVDALVVMLVDEWSLSLPLPRDDPASLENMRAKDFDLLTKAVNAAQRELYVDFEPTNDQSSPT